MENDDKKSCDLQTTQQIIFNIINVIHNVVSEVIALQDAQQRITSNDIVSISAQPSFDESTRDGYVITPHVGADEHTNQYEIIDEIPAGKPYLKTLQPGTACKIMTGGCVPEGGLRVVPSE